MTQVEQTIKLANGSHRIRLTTTLSGEEINISTIDEPEGDITLSRAQAAALVVGLKRLLDDTGELAMLSSEQDTSDPDVRNAIDEICARLGVTVDWDDEG